MEIKMASEEACGLIAQQTEPPALETTMTRVQLFKAGNRVRQLNMFFS